MNLHSLAPDGSVTLVNTIDLAGFRQTTSYYPRVRTFFWLAKDNFMLYKAKLL